MKSFTRSLRALFTASLVAAGYAAAQQPPHPQEPQHQHQKPEQNPAQDQSKQEMQHGEHQMTMRTVEPVYPRMGKAQEQAKGPLMTLTSLQRLAAQSNPTLRQAEAEIRAAKARQQQAGLYPNPTVGYTGDEIRGGSVGGGKQGFFVSQPIVTAGKLGKNRQIFGQEIRLAEVEAEEQKMRIESAVRIAFYRVLAAQELLEAQRDLARIAQDNAETEHRLSNTGQAMFRFRIEVEARRRQMAVRVRENTLRQEWRGLTAVIGKPDLALQVVDGNLEADLPRVNEEEVVEAIAKESPAVRIAAGSTTRAQAVLERSEKRRVGKEGRSR